MLLVALSLRSKVLNRDLKREGSTFDVPAINLWAAEQKLERSSGRLIENPITCVAYLRSSLMRDNEERRHYCNA